MGKVNIRKWVPDQNLLSILSPCIVTWALKYHMKLINREKCSYKGIFH